MKPEEASIIYQEMKSRDELLTQFEKLRPAVNPFREVLTVVAAVTVGIVLPQYVELTNGEQNLLWFVLLMIAAVESLHYLLHKNTNKRIDIMYQLLKEERNR